MNPALPTGGGSPSAHTGPATAASKKPANSVRESFRRFSAKAAGAVGSPWAFAIATAAIIIWAILGPHYRYSDTWQLVINTGTTIVTFLMVFLIQNTQNRDARAIHLKLDELIHGLEGPRNKLVDLEDCTEEEIAELEKEFRRVREKLGTRHTNGKRKAQSNEKHDERREPQTARQ